MPINPFVAFLFYHEKMFILLFTQICISKSSTVINKKFLMVLLSAIVNM